MEAMRSLKAGATTAAASFGTRGDRTTFHPILSCQLLTSNRLRLGVRLTQRINIKSQIFFCVRNHPVIPSKQVIYRLFYTLSTDSVA